MIVNTNSKEIDNLLDYEYEQFKGRKGKRLNENLIGSGHKKENKENMPTNFIPSFGKIKEMN